jgi:hypothetical protein
MGDGGRDGRAEREASEERDEVGVGVQTRDPRPDGPETRRSEGERGAYCSTSRYVPRMVRPQAGRVNG